MPLLCLPTELVICIAENFELASDILRLATTNNQLFCILLPVLYRFNVQQQNSSALLWSAKSGNPKVAETMIHEYKADVSAVHEHNTPLIWAAIHGSVSVVKILLRAPGISVNFRNHKRETALWWAANHGYTSIVEELLREKDIEIDCQDTSYGLTPLAAAACYGHAEITRQLLATGRVDIHKQNRLHQTPIFLAILNRNEEVMQTLLDEKALDLACQDNVGRNLLSVAALKGQISVVKTLLRKGVAVNTVDHQGETPLDKAIAIGNVGVTEAILERSIRVDSSPESEGSHGVAKSLFIAAQRGRIEIARLLLDHGFDVNARDSTGRTPLHFAALTGNPGMTRVILGCQDINVNAQDILGITPLHHAVKKRSVPVIKLLIGKSQLDPNITDNKGRTPFSWAADNDDLDIMKLLPYHKESVHCG